MGADTDVLLTTLITLLTQVRDQLRGGPLQDAEFNPVVAKQWAAVIGPHLNSGNTVETFIERLNGDTRLRDQFVEVLDVRPHTGASAQDFISFASNTNVKGPLTQLVVDVVEKSSGLQTALFHALREDIHSYVHDMDLDIPDVDDFLDSTKFKNTVEAVVEEQVDDALDGLVNNLIIKRR